MKQMLFLLFSMFLLNCSPSNNEIWYKTKIGNHLTPNARITGYSNEITAHYKDGDKFVYQFSREVLMIDYEAFEGNMLISQMVLPSTVVYIYDRAFAGCSNLKSINIPKSVKKIGSGAFKNCKKLTSIVIENSVCSIGDSAFENCSNLVIKVPKTCWHAKNAFKGVKEVIYYYP